MKPERIQFKGPTPKSSDGFIHMTVTVTFDIAAKAVRGGIEMLGNVLGGLFSLKR